MTVDTKRSRKNLNKVMELNPKLELIKESNFWDEMKKYTFVGKIGSVLAKDLNNRLAVYKWKRR